MASGEMQSLTRAIAILDCFTTEEPQLGVREIARMVDMSVSTVGRMLASLNALGMLSQDPDTRLYRMGSRAMAYGMVYAASLDIRESARPMLEALYRLTKETVSLYVLERDERVCAAVIESPERLRVVVRVGERMPLHAGSAGKAILAFMPPDDVTRILGGPLEKITSRTITSKDRLLAELADIREKGYATSHGERFEDVIGIAAPIFDGKGAVVAALNVAGPSQRFNDEAVRKHCPRILELADQVSLLLGFAGHSGPARRPG